MRPREVVLPAVALGVAVALAVALAVVLAAAVAVAGVVAVAVLPLTGISVRSRGIRRAYA